MQIVNKYFFSKIHLWAPIVLFVAVWFVPSVGVMFSPVLDRVFSIVLVILPVVYYVLTRNAYKRNLLIRLSTGVVGFLSAMLFIGGLDGFANNSAVSVGVLGGVLFLIISLVGFAGFTLLCLWPKRCKSCKKIFAVVKVNTRKTDEERIEVDVDVERKNLQGDTIGYDCERRGGIREHFESEYKCKYCGFVVTQQESRDMVS